MSMPSKSCELDILPTPLFKDVLGSIISPLTNIVNTSLRDGMFATNWKRAIIRPLIKKQGLDQVLANYRPVSNLSFTSKVVEKAILKQLNTHFDMSAPLPDYQSAYRPHYSCETALVSLMDDLLWGLERKQVTQMCFMDLSAAFDTVDHEILLNVLNFEFGVKGTALEWFSNYLDNRTSSVMVNSSQSSFQSVDFSVPQGSLLGPVLYSVYASTLQYIIPDQFELHAYADDHAIKQSHTANAYEAKLVNSQMSQTMQKVKIWMDMNRLKLNESKTEFIMFGSKQMVDRCQVDSLTVNGMSIDCSTSIKYLGVFLDQSLTLKKQVATKCRAAMAGLRLIRNIRHMLTQDACHTIWLWFLAL